MRIRTIGLLISIVVGAAVHGQEPALPQTTGKAGWSNKEWRSANTARFSLYMPKSVRESIRFMNLSRMYGEKFAKIYLDPLPEKTQFELSLIKTLSKKVYKEPLRPSLNLWGSALVGSVYYGFKGEACRSRSYGRISWLNPLGFGMEIGENSVYAARSGLEITLKLLIDSGVPAAGHRKNILNPEFARVGGFKFYNSTFGNNTFFDYSSLNLNDMFFGRRPDNRQWGLNLEAAQLSRYPMANAGLAYYANHMGTTHLFADLNYHYGIGRNHRQAVSAQLSYGSSFGVAGNLLLGTRVTAFKPFDSPCVSIQPTVSWFILANILRNGYFLELNDTQRSAAYRFTYGYQIPLSANKSPFVTTHNFTVSRFICLGSISAKKKKK